MAELVVLESRKKEEKTPLEQTEDHILSRVENAKKEIRAIKRGGRDASELLSELGLLLVHLSTYSGQVGR